MDLQKRALLRDVMTTAWKFFRSAAARGQPYDSFGQSLKSAWRFVRSNQEFAKQMRGAKRIQFSPSLIRSPIQRAAGGNRAHDFRAAYTTARLGG